MQRLLSTAARGASRRWGSYISGTFSHPYVSPPQAVVQPAKSLPDPIRCGYTLRAMVDGETDSVAWFFVGDSKPWTPLNYLEKEAQLVENGIMDKARGDRIVTLLTVVGWDPVRVEMETRALVQEFYRMLAAADGVDFMMEHAPRLPRSPIARDAVAGTGGWCAVKSETKGCPAATTRRRRASRKGTWQRTRREDMSGLDVLKRRAFFESGDASFWTWEMQGYCSARPAGVQECVGCWVYLVSAGDDVYYVGKTIDVHRRQLHHIQNGQLKDRGQSRMHPIFGFATGDVDYDDDMACLAEQMLYDKLYVPGGHLSGNSVRPAANVDVRDGDRALLEGYVMMVAGYIQKGEGSMHALGMRCIAGDRPLGFGPHAKLLYSEVWATEQAYARDVMARAAEGGAEPEEEAAVEVFHVLSGQAPAVQTPCDGRMGFGKHADLLYSVVWRRHRAYAHWVMEQAARTDTATQKAKLVKAAAYFKVALPVAAEKEEVMGFGKYATLGYREVWVQHRSYAIWVLEQAAAGGKSCRQASFAKAAEAFQTMLQGGDAGVGIRAAAA